VGAPRFFATIIMLALRRLARPAAASRPHLRSPAAAASRLPAQFAPRCCSSSAVRCMATGAASSDGDAVLELNKQLLASISRMDFEAYAKFMHDDISCFEPEAAHQQVRSAASNTVSRVANISHREVARCGAARDRQLRLWRVPRSLARTSTSIILTSRRRRRAAPRLPCCPVRFSHEHAASVSPRVAAGSCGGPLHLCHAWLAAC
jgi:hypothetical protein